MDLWTFWLGNMDLSARGSSGIWTFWLAAIRLISYALRSKMIYALRSNGASDPNQEPPIFQGSVLGHPLLRDHRIAVGGSRQEQPRARGRGLERLAGLRTSGHYGQHHHPNTGGAGARHCRSRRCSRCFQRGPARDARRKTSQANP
jgi:hypothetical protein